MLPAVGSSIFTKHKHYKSRNALDILNLSKMVSLLIIMWALGTVACIDLSTDFLGWKKYCTNPKSVKIVSGSYSGRSGNLVSMSWLGNGYNTRATVNVPRDTLDEAGQSREWVKVWSWEIIEK